MLSRRKLRLLKGLHHPRGRRRHGLFLVEGPRGVAEAVQAGWPLEEVFLDPAASPGLRAVVVAGLEARSVPRISVTREDLLEMSDTVAPQPVVATARMRRPDLDRTLATRSGPVLVVAGVQDPGNLGALLRTADAFGCSPVLLLKGTVDPYNPKAVRGAMGALFHLEVGTDIDVDGGVSLLSRHGFRLLAAVPRGGIDHRNLETGGAQALCVGGEGGGLPHDLVDQVDARVTVHTPGQAESLNVVVAAGILLDRLVNSPSAS